MSDLFFILVVLIIGVGGLFMLARLLDQRGKRVQPPSAALPAPRRLGKILLWIARGFLVLTVLFIAGAFAFRSMSMVSLAGSCLFLYFLDGIAYRIVLQRER